MKKDAVPVDIRGILPANSGCAIFVGNDEKVFVIQVEHNMGQVISMFLRETPKERPLTHDLIARTSDSAISPVVLIWGADEFTVKQRAKEIYTRWCAQLGGLDHEVIDAAVNNGAEALKAVARLREALQTLPFFGSAKAVWFQNCSFLGDERTASAQAVTESLTDLAQELKKFSWDNVRLLISAGKVDKRKVFFKAIEKIGAVESFTAW